METMVRNTMIALALLSSAFALVMLRPATADGAQTTAKPKVTLSPSEFEPANSITMTVKGSHFGRRKTVSLLVGPPNSEALEVATVKTKRNGSFKKRLTLQKAQPGSYVLLACRRSCAIKASAPFTIG